VEIQKIVMECSDWILENLGINGNRGVNLHCSLEDRGATVNAPMGLNTWAALIETRENAVVAKNFAMLESEVTPDLKALWKTTSM
jgi:hypothetical protein